MSWSIVGRNAAVAGFVVGIAVTAAPIRATTEETSAPVTFNRDVLPILQKNCQTCHRPGEIAPFSMLTYQSTRPWARAMKNAVVSRQMPPWFAEEGYAHYANDTRLNERDIQTIAAWADSGAAEGDAKDKPAPVEFPDGWNIKPDMIVEMPIPFDVPATGTINYQNFLVKTNFPEDTWVIAAEMRPGDPKVVHHMRANVRPPTSSFMKDAVLGIPYENGDKRIGRSDGSVDLLGKFNPGLGDQAFSEFGAAKFVPKGSDIIFNIHYTAGGAPTTDRSKVGLVFARPGYKPAKRYFVHNGATASNLAIPPYERNAEVVGELTTQQPMQLAYMQPHMHLRGKDFEMRLIFPSGETRTVLKGRWDFNWQLGYDLAEPIDLPVGTRIVSIGRFDNSTGNKFNPDPSRRVLWGDQNWEEMQNIFIGVLIDPAIDTRTLFKASGPSLLPRGESGPTLSTLLQPPASR